MSNSHETSSKPESSLELRSEQLVGRSRSRDSRDGVRLTLDETDLEQLRDALRTVGERADDFDSIELRLLSLDIELQTHISRARTADGPLPIVFGTVDAELMALAYLRVCRADSETDPVLGSLDLSPQLGLELFANIRDGPPATAPTRLPSPTVR